MNSGKSLVERKENKVKIYIKQLILIFQPPKHRTHKFYFFIIPIFRINKELEKKCRKYFSISIKYKRLFRN